MVDKSLGTNLHLWLFFTRAKRTARRKFIYIFSAAPPPSTMLDTCYFSRGSTLYGAEGGKATHFETENSAFLKLRFKHTKLVQLHKCPKELCPPLSDFHVSLKNAQLRCFLALNVFRTRECEHLSLKRHFLELLPGFFVFF